MELLSFLLDDHAPQAADIAGAVSPFPVEVLEIQHAVHRHLLQPVCGVAVALPPHLEPRTFCRPEAQDHLLPLAARALAPSLRLSGDIFLLRVEVRGYKEWLLVLFVPVDVMCGGFTDRALWSQLFDRGQW
jgi:hypothetical protein